MNNWLWTSENDSNTYVMARRSFDMVGEVENALLDITADSRYMLWINGSYLGRGPVPFKLPNVFYDTYDLSEYLTSGKNTLAVLAVYHGVRHCTYTPDIPGIFVRGKISLKDGSKINLCADSDWKSKTLDAYIKKTPRRTWATAFAEYYDARLEPEGWKETDFDDSDWKSPVIVKKSGVIFHKRITPYLNEEYTGFKDIVLTGNVNSGIPFLQDNNGVVPSGLTGFLDEEHIEFTNKSDPLTVEASEEGRAVTFDMGREYAGSIYFEIETGEGTFIDICPAENLKEKRPWCSRKNGEYARRYITKKGINKFSFFGYDGIRYIHMVIRGPHPLTVIKDVGVIRRETSLLIKAEFSCSNEKVNRIWEITKNTYYAGSQEIQVDCPTREQTSAWGDNILSGLWTVYFTGESSYLKHLLLTLDHVIMKDGQLPCYPFSSVHNISSVHEQLPLYDYSLIAVSGLLMYYEMTSDIDFVKTLIPSAKRILEWYRQRKGTSNLIEPDFSDLWNKRIGQLFIDHPGLGTHNAPHPGINRRGINAAINFFYIIAAEDFSKLLRESGHSDEAVCLEKEVDVMRRSAFELFYDPCKNVFVDGYINGERSLQISQQTNALAVLSKTLTGEKAEVVLLNMLESKDESLCLCGTYFWYYLAAALCKENMHGKMFDKMFSLWNEMVEKGASTWWETFTGDELDSLCHIWSSAPGYFLFSDLLGIKPSKTGFRDIIIKPRIDLMDRAEGSLVFPEGKINISWYAEEAINISIYTTGEISGSLKLPGKYVIEKECKNTLDFSPGIRKTVKAVL